MGPTLFLAGTALITLAFLALRLSRLERSTSAGLSNDPVPALHLHQPVDLALSTSIGTSTARRAQASTGPSAPGTPRTTQVDYSAALESLERHLQRVAGDLEQRLPEQLSLLDRLIEAGDREIQALQLRLADPTAAQAASLPSANRQPDLLLLPHPEVAGHIEPEDRRGRSLPFKPQLGKPTRRKAA